MNSLERALQPIDLSQYSVKPSSTVTPSVPLPGVPQRKSPVAPNLNAIANRAVASAQNQAEHAVKRMLTKLQSLTPSAATAVSGGGPILETNGTLNGDQTALNLIAGANIVLTNSGADVTIDASASGGDTTANYILGATDALLVNSTVIPYLATSPDSPPVSPNAKDDEFPGSSLDPKWTWVNQSTATAAVSNSCLIMSIGGTGAVNENLLVQTAPATPWTITAKVFAFGNARGVSGAGCRMGLVARDSVSGHFYTHGFIGNGGNASIGPGWYTNTTTWANFTGLGAFSTWTNYVYFRISYAAPTTSFLWSFDGVKFFLLGTSTSYAPDQIGLLVDSAVTGGFENCMVCDWFRVT